LRQCRRVISRRLAAESTLRFAFGASCAKKRATSAAVLTKPAADRKPGSMAACERRILGKRHVGLGFAQARGFHDFALDPGAIRLPGDRLDDKAD
jgi:hypothetical protein